MGSKTSSSFSVVVVDEVSESDMSEETEEPNGDSGSDSMVLYIIVVEDYLLVFFGF